MKKSQVGSGYHNMAYLSRERWVSFWYQIMEVMGQEPESVLEVGLGPGVVIEAIRGFGVHGVAMDIDIRVKPDVVSDVTNLPFKNDSFDVALAAEILEHIPFNETSRALKELARVAKKAIIITLPHFHHFAPLIALKIFPFVPRVKKVFPISIFSPKHQFDGQHYWEIGKRGYSLKRIKKLLKDSTGFRLVKDYLIVENPYHHVFVLRKL